MKKLFTIFGLAISIASFGQVPSNIPTDSLMAWYPFYGNANDESGNGYNGTVNGATLTSDRNGNGNNAYLFNGSSAYIQIGDMPIGAPYQPLTVSIWWQNNSAQTSGVGAILTDYDGATGGDYTFAFSPVLNYADNRITIDRRYGSGGDQQVQTNPINGSAWHHIALIYDGINRIYYYQDGVAIDSMITWNGIVNGTLAIPTYDASKNYYGNPIWRIGCDRWQGNLQEFFEGKIDDIGIWNRALTQSEISQLYQNCTATITTQPSSQNAAGGDTAQFFTQSSDTSATYDWQVNTGGGFSNITNNCNYSGANSNTLTIPASPVSFNNNFYRCVITNGSCNDTTAIAQLSVDTFVTTVYDTTYVTDTVQIYDTTFVTITDTVTVTDTTYITVYDSISVTDTLIIDVNTGLNPPNNVNTIKVFPNPAKTHIYIDNGNFNLMSGYKIAIENSIGQQVFFSLVNQQQFFIDLSNWGGNGTYFVKIMDAQNNTVDVRKIILQ